MVIFTFIPVTLFPQGEWNQWRFGHRHGLDFNSGSPVSTPNYGGGFFSEEINTGMSDSLGNLLFYANDYAVYNKNNAQMPNGSGLLGSYLATEQAFAVQAPGDPQKYFLFTMNLPISPDYRKGLYYSVIDMTLVGGLGDVVAGQKNIAVPSADRTINVLTGTRHLNNKDVWIVTRVDSGYSYLAYRITNAGINLNPVVSNSLAYIHYPESRPFMIRISQDGRKLVCLYDTVGEYCNFNPATGQITPLFLFWNEDPYSPFSTFATAEFSVESKFLYINNSFGGPGEASPIRQYDAQKTDSLEFVQSMTLVGDNLGVSSLQLGPDDKIYTQRLDWGWDSLGVINNPSQQGLGCNFIRALFALNGGTNHYRGFPQFLQRYYLYMNHTGQCQGDSISFSYITWPPADSLFWNFGDPASGSANVSNSSNPKHKFNSPGNYLIMLIARHKDQRFDTVLQTVTILANPVPSLGPDPTICQGDSKIFDAGPCAGCSFLWTDFPAGTILGTSQTFTTGLAGTYVVKVTSADGCIGHDTVQLFTTAPPVVTTAPLFKSICSGDSTRISLTSNIAGTTFSWTGTGSSGLVAGFSPGTGDTINQKLVSTSTVDETVTYWITPVTGNCTGDSVGYVVTVTQADSSSMIIDTLLCYGTPYFAEGAWQTAAGTYHDTLDPPVSCVRYVITNLSYKPKIPVDLGADTTLCGDNLTLDASIPGGTCLWQDGTTDPVYVVTHPGEYSVAVTYDGCIQQDSINILGCPVNLWFPSAFTPNGDGLNDIFRPKGSGVENFSMQIFNRWGTMIFETTSIESGWDGTINGAPCPVGTYAFSATYEAGNGQKIKAKGSVTLYR